MVVTNLFYFILSALRLDNNELKDINGLVSSQKNLKWLNVSTNQIQVNKRLNIKIDRVS